MYIEPCMNICMCSDGVYLKIILKGLVCDKFISRFIRLVVPITYMGKGQWLSITL